MNTLETYRLEKSKMFYDTFSLSTVMLAIWAWLTFGETGRAVKSSWRPGVCLATHQGISSPKN